MMHFTIDGHEVWVQFHHLANEPEEGYVCTEAVVQSDHPELAKYGGEIFGRAFCHPNDMFCKKTGRRIALGRALYVVDDKDERLISREFTKKFWPEYFKQIPADKVNTKQRWVQLPDGTFVRMAYVVDALRLMDQACRDDAMDRPQKFDPAQGDPNQTNSPSSCLD